MLCLLNYNGDTEVNLCPYSLGNSSCSSTNMDGIVWRSVWKTKSSVSHCQHIRGSQASSYFIKINISERRHFKAS